MRCNSIPAYWDMLISLVMHSFSTFFLKKFQTEHTYINLTANVISSVSLIPSDIVSEKICAEVG